MFYSSCLICVARVLCVVCGLWFVNCCLLFVVLLFGLLLLLFCCLMFVVLAYAVYFLVFGLSLSAACLRLVDVCSWLYVFVVHGLLCVVVVCCVLCVV